jgi:hypothetical protein
MKSHELKNRDKTRSKKKGGKQRAIKNQIEKREKTIKQQVKKAKRGGKKLDKKAIKEKEPKIKILAHELLTSTLSYLMLAPLITPLRTPPISNLDVLCLSSYYRFVLLFHYKLVPPQASVGYV